MNASFFRHAPRVAGSLVVLLGLTVIVGWSAHWTAAIQVVPGFAPMQFNTALCFVFCGSALIIATTPQRSRSPWLGGLAGLLALLTLLEYATGKGFGIDELFFKAYIVTVTSIPGRMSPLSAACFLSVGSALVLSGSSLTARWRSLAVGSLASMAVALSAMAVFGYVFGLPGTYGWGHLTGMAVHTAAGLAVLGLGVFTIAWNDAQIKLGRTPVWLPVPIALAGATASFILQQALEARQTLGITEVTKATASDVRNQIEAQMSSHLKAIERMAQRWEFSGPLRQEAWEDDARNYVQDFQDFQAIEWADASYHIRWVVPLEGNENVVNRDLTQEPRRRAAVLQAQELRRAVISRPVQLVQGGTGFIIYRAIYVAGNFDGLIVGVLRAEPLFGNFLYTIAAKGNSIVISDGDQEFYERNLSPPPDHAEWMQNFKLREAGVEWNVQVWPTPELADELRSPLATLEFLAGLILSALLAGSVRLLQVARAEVAERKSAEAKLAGQAEELLRSNRELEQFAYVASHDMREPLRSISGFAQILKRKYQANLDAKAGEMLAGIVDAAARMGSIIDALLALSRLSSQGARFEPTALERPLGLALQNLAVAIRERDAQVRHAALPSLPVVSPQLVLLFQNLIGNAIKFKREGVAEVHITAAQGPDGFWKISVRDNGIGIEPQYFDRIFGIFQRLHTREEYPGTGIGLAICKKVVERHGGQIWLESELGQGTTFFFTLPESRAE